MLHVVRDIIIILLLDGIVVIPVTFAQHPEEGAKDQNGFSVLKEDAGVQRVSQFFAVGGGLVLKTLEGDNNGRGGRRAAALDLLLAHNYSGGRRISLEMSTASTGTSSRGLGLRERGAVCGAA
jgi:hypothetical protein